MYGPPSHRQTRLGISILSAPCIVRRLRRGCELGCEPPAPGSSASGGLERGARPDAPAAARCKALSPPATIASLP